MLGMVKIVSDQGFIWFVISEDLNSTHRTTGNKLSEAMDASGAKLDLIKSKSLINSKKIEVFIEIHIEQGPVLVDKDWPIAIVTGIRGNYRHHKIRCKGDAGHSTIPRYLRKDTVFAGADLITRMDDHWNTIEQHGRPCPNLVFSPIWIIKRCLEFLEKFYLF